MFSIPNTQMLGWCGHLADAASHTKAGAPLLRGHFASGSRARAVAKKPTKILEGASPPVPVYPFVTGVT